MNTLAKALMKIDTLKKEWDEKHPLAHSSLAALQEKLRAQWTYNSNALEGNTLTLGETIFFLREGLTSQGKPLKDYLEAKNHAQAIDFLRDVIVENRALTTGLLKDLNQLLLAGVDFSVAMNEQGQKIQKKISAGQYKTQPNHVLTLSGKIHRYVEPVHVASEMEVLVQKACAALQNKDAPVLAAADLHYGVVRIHPFDDGNGRVARLAMNLFFMKCGFPPIIIPVAERREYLDALASADEGDKNPFYEFIATCVVSTLTDCLAEIG